MSTIKRRATGWLLVGLGLATAGCTSLTRSEEIRVSKDAPKSRIADAAAAAEQQAEAQKAAAAALAPQGDAAPRGAKPQPLQAAPRKAAGG